MGVSVPSWFKSKKSVETVRPTLDELVALCRRYLIQETLDPIKAMARGLLTALGGAVLFALGGIIALIGVLRLLQDETGSVFAGDWSFAPYLLTAVVGAALIGLAALVTFRSTASRAERS